MYGYLFYPKNAKQGSHPVVLTPPGAGIKTIKEPLRNKYYAENGFIRFEIEIHGLDPRLPAETFQEISKGFNDRNGAILPMAWKIRTATTCAMCIRDWCAASTS